MPEPLILTIVDGKQEQEPEATFDDFWLLYPRRIAKRDALRAWDKLPDGNRIAAIVALVDWRKVWEKRDDIEYVPYPASWLNGWRWEDELPAEFKRSHAAHAPAKLPDSPARTVIPDHVRALLAKLRGKA